MTGKWGRSRRWERGWCIPEGMLPSGSLITVGVSVGRRGKGGAQDVEQVDRDISELKLKRGGCKE